MKIRTRWMRTAGVLLAASLLAAGCGGGDGGSGPAPTGDAQWQAVVKAANKEGHVTWYTMAPQSAQEALKKAFEKKYPDISVKVRSMGIAELNSALEAEKKTGAEGADVATSVAYSWVYEKEKAGWFADLTGGSLKAPEWTSSGYLVNNKIVVAPLGLIVLGWNATLLPGGVKTYTDLLNPKLGNGAIGVVQPEPAIHADNWAFIEKNFDQNWLQKLAAQKPTVFPSAFALQEALAAGEVAVGSFVSATDMVGLQDKGAPVKFAVTNPAWAAQNLFFALKSAKHPNAAQVFMDFFASPEGQLAAARNGYSPLKDVAPKTLGGKSRVVLTDVKQVLDPKWGPEYLARWKQTFGK
ncbi:ABC transporter substrate-binding protein [Actinomadura rugatobispora]|uniref:ABC transporter substrate-binding protein n=1 Tax=Actinomadura rugatobispora TaxID=1994 RepID=A0ABW1A8Z7_9ACTN|nr:hypothetical protein GCM10010200_015680 [Actinomadura rugatobispora]